MEYLRIPPQLIELTLDDNSLGDDGAMLLRRKYPSSLKRLSLAGCNITADGLKSIPFDLLNLDRLDVSRNCFSANEAWQVLGKACKGMKLFKEGNQVVFESRSPSTISTSCWGVHKIRRHLYWGQPEQQQRSSHGIVEGSKAQNPFARRQ